MSVDPSQIVTFDKSIILSYNEGLTQTSNGTIGQLRFNQSTYKFEGYHGSNGALLGEIWRPLTQDIATASNLGVIKVGTNLNINPSTGVLSAISTGSSRFTQLVITVSPILGAGDYQTINEAITSAIGTPGGGYLDGILTSNLGSSPSPTYPFVIQLGPGQYIEQQNQIILPDYVSLFGENNYNSVINLNTGNNTVSTGSMIIVGQNACINNLSINIADTSASNITNGLYISNKSNVVVNNCIFTTSSNCNTTQETSFIWMENSSTTNRITNCQFNINTSSLTGNVSALYISNSNPIIQNNKININASNANVSTGIKLVNCTGIPSYEDTIILDNLQIYNNYENITTGITNYGIHITNSTTVITNTIIECNNDPAISSNYGIVLEADTPLITSTSTGVLAFIHYTTVGQLDRITSNNTSSVNFTTLGLVRGQYITISGSGSNDGIYKIANVVSNSILELEASYRVINETASGSYNIILEALYYINVEKTNIIGSTNSIWNIDSNSRYIVNQNNNIIQGDIELTPARILYTNYKTITVGKENCDYTLVSTALADITDNSASNQYNILVHSGIYQEPAFIQCKPYVNIKGDGIQNTTIQFYQAEDSVIAGTPTSNSSCLLLASHSNINNLKIINSSTLNTSNSTTSVLYMADAPVPTNADVILEDLEIVSVCGSVYNYGIYLSNASNITLNTVNMTVQTNDNSTTTPELNVGLVCYSSNSIICNDMNIVVVSNITNDNVGMKLVDTNTTLNNITCVVNSGITQNTGIQTQNTTMTENLVEIFNGIINASDNIEYSLFADDYYTIVCNGVDIIGATYTSPVSSRIICNGCYTFTSSAYNTSYQSLSSRGENEQALGTITIGDSAGNLGSSGANNTFIGVNSGSSITSGSNNTGIGNNSGAQLTIASDNTLVGSHAGAVLNDNYNTIIGSNAGSSLQTGSENIVIGYNTASTFVDGSVNVIIGSQAGTNLSASASTDINTIVGTYSYITTTNNLFGNTTLGFATGAFANSGNLNVFIGAESGLYSGGDNNVLVGTESGLFNYASNITAVGTSAGMYNNNGAQNTYLGFQAGLNSTGNCNTIVGNNTGYSNTSSTASYNTILGTEAGYSLDTGSRNVLIGSISAAGGDAPGWNLSTGNDNIILGVNTGSNATSAINNVMIGSNVGSSITSAGNNVLIGKDTATSLTTAGQSVIIGAGAGVNNTVGNALIIGYSAGIKNISMGAFAIGYSAGSNVSGDFNMFMGYNAGGLPKLNTTGAYNIAIGPYTGYNLTSGTRNVILGSGDAVESAGRLISTGSDNTLMGYKAGRALQLGSGNTLIGSNAGANLTNGIDNLLLGYKSGFNLNTGSYNVVLGPEAGYNLNIGGYNIYAGYQSAYNNQSGNYNINIGYKTGFTSTTNGNNIHIGFEAGYDSIADDNIFIGTSAGVQNTTGTNNIFCGSGAGYGNNPNNQQIGDNNIFMGNNAGNANENGYRNIFLGYQSGKASIAGSKNVFIGENTGSTGSTSHNIFIGSARDDNKGVGYLTDASGEYNVFVGHDVGIANTTGDHNIFMGDSAGKNNTTGTQNIYIGTNAGRDANAGTADNNIAMGTDAGILNQSGKENILIGKQVAGLSTSTNYNQNIIIGSEAGQNIQQDNQIFIGTNAGKNNTTGNRNIFIGLNAGTANIDSQDNIVIGSDAGVSLVGAGGIGDNVIIGSQAGQDLTTGINNIFIGSNSGANAITANNNVVIGANSMSVGDASNVIIMGNEAGKLNDADYNICIGYKAGENHSNPDGDSNIIMGSQALPNGSVASNNIIIGTDVVKNVDNERDFANNVVIGRLAGINSNVSSGSIIMGTSSGGIGSGGDNNILVGYQAGVNLGILYKKLELTEEIGVGDNFAFIEIPFGSAVYYFEYGDVVKIYNPSVNDEWIQVIITSIQYYNSTITKFIFSTISNIVLPVGSIIYKLNSNSTFLGNLDNSKSSNNICLGFQTGMQLTDGSKNSTIGVNSLFFNKVGNNNVALGTNSAYRTNTNNNLCLGTNAGYSINEYNGDTGYQNMIFYNSNNTIIFPNGVPELYYYGTVFEIDGSSGNDSRYNISDCSSNAIIVQGFPNIIEAGLPVNVSADDFKFNDNNFFFINNSQIINNGTFDENTKTLKIIYPTLLDANNAFNDIQNALSFSISNSSFNDGIHIINSLTQNGSNIDIITDTGFYGETITSNINFIVRNIVCENTQSSPYLEFQNLNPQNKFYLQFGNDKGAYTVSNDMITRNTNNSSLINGTYVDEDITNKTIINNLLYIDGRSSNVPATSFNPEYFYTNNTVIFDSTANTITSYADILVISLESSGLIKITGTQYNDGYYYFVSILTAGSTYIYNISSQTPIVSDETITIPTAILFELMPRNFSIFSNIFGNNTNWNGKLINFDYKINYGSEDLDNHGAYVLEYLYNNSCGVGDQIINSYIDNSLEFNQIDKTIVLSGKGVDISSNAFKNYISGSDLIYQNSNITLSAILYTSNSTLVCNDNYGFVDFIAPVMIKIENSTAGNDGYYLVKENHNPYNTMVIDGSFPGSNETATITIKQNSISTMMNTSNLASFDTTKQYVIYGSKYNDGIEIIPASNSAIHKSSIYCNETTQLINDVNGEYELFLAKSSAYYTSLPVDEPNVGHFMHFEYTSISVDFPSTTSILITIATGTPLYDSINLLSTGHYIKINNSSSNDGIYVLASIPTYSAGAWTITVNSSYIRNGIAYNGTPFTTGTSITIDLICNQFINTIDPTYVNILNYQTLLTGLGDNAKWLSFYHGNSNYLYIYPKSLTFEIDSFPLNAISGDSSIALSLTETCPNETAYAPYYITIGEPNPNTLRTSDIHRQKKRPILYSSMITKHGFVDTYTSNNTISIVSTIRPDGTFTENKSYYYGKPASAWIFDELVEGEVIAFVLKTKFVTQPMQYGLITSISADKKQITLDGSYSSVSTTTGNWIEIYKQLVIRTDRLNFNQISNVASNDINYKFIRMNGNSGSALDINFYQTNSYINFTNTNVNNIVLVNTIPPPITTTTYGIDGFHMTRRHNVIMNTEFIQSSTTNIYFHNHSIVGTNDINFYSSNNTIISTITDLSGFKAGECIQITGTTNNNKLYRIDENNIPTTNLLVLSNVNPVFTEIGTSATILANCINSSNVVATPLSIFGPCETLIVSKTLLNNTSYTSNIIITSSDAGYSFSPYSIFIDTPSVINEYPEYCVIEKSMFQNEKTIYQGNNDITFYSANNSIYTSNGTIGFDAFRIEQNISISNTTSNNTDIQTNNIPSVNSITTDTNLVDEINTNAILTKLISFNIIGTPVVTQITSTYNEFYHFEDAEGNNTMIGSYAGLYTGKLNDSIYNVSIGSRCGQVNHGSGNIFIGSESKLATNPFVGSTTYNNKFAIYKNNYIGISSKPLISGDFGTGIVGINTMTPEAFTYSSIDITETKLVVVGSAIANSFSPFTGCHIIVLEDNENIPTPGMILSSSGNVSKQSVINTFCTVKISNKINDKSVFGVYAYSQQFRKNNENEYIINTDGKYIKNTNYSNELNTTHFCASVGEGCILVSNITGDIGNGDYITSSVIPGYGCLQSDDLMHSYTVAKCTQNIDWNSVPENVICPIDGKMYKSLLVACTYHCG